MVGGVAGYLLIGEHLVTGGPVFGAVGRGCVDVRFLDPVFARSPGDPCCPRTFGHSDHPDDEQFAVTVHALWDGTTCAAVADPAGGGVVAAAPSDGPDRRTSDTATGV